MVEFAWFHGFECLFCGISLVGMVCARQSLVVVTRRNCAGFTLFHGFMKIGTQDAIEMVTTNDTAQGGTQMDTLFITRLDCTQQTMYDTIMNMYLLGMDTAGETEIKLRLYLNFTVAQSEDIVSKAIWEKI